MGLTDPPDDVKEHLREALSVDDVTEKDFHVRQAIQLLQLEE